MSGLDALQSVQFITKKGKRFAVVAADDWDSLIEWLETVEDVQTALRAMTDLKAAKGSRKRAGWHKWEDVKGSIR